MTRLTWLLPLSLGLLLACDGSDLASPDENVSLSTVETAAAVVIDVQPIPDLEKAVINLRTDHITVAVLGTSVDVATLDLGTIAFVGVGEMHLARMDGPNCDFDSGHFRDVDADGVGDAVFHFASQDIQPVAGSIADGGWCLTGQTLDGAAFTACEAAPVKVVYPAGQ